MDWEKMNQEPPLNRPSLMKIGQRMRGKPAKQIAAVKLFPTHRSSNLKTLILVNSSLMLDLLKAYPFHEKEIVIETWAMYRARKKKMRARSENRGNVLSPFITDHTPDRILRQIAREISPVGLLDAGLQLSRCPQWLADKIKVTVLESALDEDSHQIFGRLEYMGMMKEWLTTVETY